MRKNSVYTILGKERRHKKISHEEINTFGRKDVAVPFLCQKVRPGQEI
jgi:hypothetical protein